MAAKVAATDEGGGIMEYRFDRRGGLLIVASEEACEASELLAGRVARACGSLENRGRVDDFSP